MTEQAHRADAHLANAEAAATIAQQVLAEELAGKATNPADVPDARRITPQQAAMLISRLSGMAGNMATLVQEVRTLMVVGPPGDTPLRHSDGHDPITASRLARQSLIIAQNALREAHDALAVALDRAAPLTTAPPPALPGGNQ